MVMRLFRTSAAPKVEATKASATANVVAFHGIGRAQWSARDTASLTRTGFTGNPVGFRCVKMISEAAAAIPLHLTDGRARFSEHPLRAVLSRPNPMQGGPDLMEAFLAQLMLSGDGYLEAAGIGPDGTPGELYVLRSDRMAVVPGPDGWPVAYDYKVGAKSHRFAMNDGLPPICHVKFFHPQDDHYGLSPLTAAATAIDVHNSASRWSKSLLDNAARPSGAIVYRGADGQGQMSAEQHARLVDEMESYHQGARNAGRPMLLEGGLDWKPMGFSPSDMEFHKTKEAAAREIALAFGVPPMLLGLPGDNTFANYQEANRAFYRMTVLPLVEKVACALTNWLPPFWGEALSLTPDLDAIPALATEREAAWRRIASADFLSDREKRSLLGLPESADDGR